MPWGVRRLSHGCSSVCDILGCTAGRWRHDPCPSPQRRTGPQFPGHAGSRSVRICLVRTRSEGGPAPWHGAEGDQACCQRARPSEAGGGQLCGTRCQSPVQVQVRALDDVDQGSPLEERSSPSVPAGEGDVADLEAASRAGGTRLRCAEGAQGESRRRRRRRPRRAVAVARAVAPPEPSPSQEPSLVAVAVARAVAPARAVAVARARSRPSRRRRRHGVAADRRVARAVAPARAVAVAVAVCGVGSVCCAAGDAWGVCVGCSQLVR